MPRLGRSERIALFSAFCGAVGAIAAILVIPQVQSFIAGRNQPNENSPSEASIVSSTTVTHGANREIAPETPPPSTAHQELVIRGTVRDSLTEQPVSNARIAVSGPTNRQIETDGYGRYGFAIEGPETAASVKLEIAAPGYEKFSQSFALTKPLTIADAEVMSLAGRRFTKLPGIWEARFDQNDQVSTHAILRFTEGSRRDRIDGTLELAFTVTVPISDRWTNARQQPDTATCRVLFPVAAGYARGSSTLKFRSGKIEQRSEFVECRAELAVTGGSATVEIYWMNEDTFTLGTGDVFGASVFKRVAV